MSKLTDCILDISKHDTDFVEKIGSRVSKIAQGSMRDSTRIRALEAVIGKLYKQKGKVETKITEAKVGVTRTGSKKANLQGRITSLQESINDPSTEENEKKRNKIELDRLLARQSVSTSKVMKGATNAISLSGKTQDVVEYSKKLTDWKKYEGNDNISTHKNAIIVKRNKNSWSVFQVAEDGSRIPVALEMKTKTDAIDALRKNQTKEEFYKENEKPEVPLTQAQNDLVSSIKNIKTFAGGVIRGFPDLVGDPEADGIVTDAVVEAARRFDSTKGAAFSTYARATAEGKLNKYMSERYANETQGVETVGDDGVSVSSLDSATRDDVYEKPVTVVQEKVKEEVPTMTRIDPNSLSEEEKAKYGQGKIAQKKTPAEQKAELEAMKQAEKQQNVETDAPVELDQKEAAPKNLKKKEEQKKLNDKKIEKPKEKVPGKAGVIRRTKKTEEDAGPTVVRRTPKQGFVDTVKVTLNKDDPRYKAREILDRSKGNKDVARTTAQAIKDDKVREEVIAHIEVMNSTTIMDALKPFDTLDPKSQKYKLAQWVKSLVQSSGKGGIRLIVDPTLKYDYFSADKSTVYIRSLDANSISLHEVMHAITSRELDVSPEIKAKVTSAMKAIEEAIVNDKNIKIDKATISRMRRAGSTSESFHKEFGDEEFDGHRGILYGLLNEKEFLAQALNDKAFQEVLLNTKAPKDLGTFRSIFEYVVRIFGEIFGKAKIHDNVMRQIMQLSAELSQVNLANSNIPLGLPIDGMMVGEKAIGVDQDSLLAARAWHASGGKIEEIRKETGWYLDKDEVWKYEVSDKEAEWLNPFTSLAEYNEEDYDAVYSLDDILVHPKLFSRYPALKEVMVYKEDLGSDTRGVYTPSTTSISMHRNLTDKEALSTLLHEIQHWVQFKEGFAKGGNVDTVNIYEHFDAIESAIEFDLNISNRSGNFERSEKLNNVLDALEDLKDAREHNKTVEGLVDSLTKEINSIFDAYSRRTKPIMKRIRELGKKTNTAEKDEVIALNEEIEKLDEELGKIADERDEAVMVLDSESNRLYNTRVHLPIPDSIKYYGYKIIAGEAESRNTQKRQDFTEEQRRGIAPESTLDIPASTKLILRWNDGSLQSQGDPTKPEKTWNERTKILESNDVNATIKQKVSHFFKKDAFDTVKKLGQGLTEMLRNIDPKLLVHLRKFEMAINDYNVKYKKMADPFVAKFKKMSKDDQRLLGLVLMNNFPADVEKRHAILKKNNMEKEYAEIVKLLDDIQSRKKKASLANYNEITAYFPRKVIDRMGLLQAIKEDPSYGVIDQELSAAGASEADRAKAIEDLANTGRYPALAMLLPGSSRARTIERVSSEWAHFYESPIEALTSHIYESNEAIEARNMFGDTRRKGLVEKRDLLYKELEGKLPGSTRKSKVQKLIGVEADLAAYNTDEGKESAWKEGIADLLSKGERKYSPDEQIKIIAGIRARLLQRGMSGPWQTLRNVSLMTALGNPTSAITQLTDFVLSMHNNGVKNTISSMFGDQILTTADLDLSHSMREFQNGGSAELLDKVLHYSGLKFMDMKAKNTYMNAAMKKARSQSLADFKKQWGDMLGNDVETTYEDLKAEKNSDLTRFFAFNALSEIQPTSMSEMPMAYLTAGNGRIFYALKSYNIKMLNVYIRKITHDVKNAKTKKDKAIAIKSAMSLMVMMTLAGAGADELKDLLMNREANFSDHVHNNFLKAFFLNSYMLEQGDKRGMIKTAVADTLLPSTRLYDDGYKDLMNLIDSEEEATFKTLKSLPWGGLVYAWTSDGHTKTQASNRKERISEVIKGGGSISDVRSDMQKYNKWARDNKKPLLTYSNIKNMRKKNKSSE